LPPRALTAIARLIRAPRHALAPRQDSAAASSETATKKQALERTARLLALAPAVIYATEIPFRTTFVSDNVRSLTGYEASAFIGTTLFVDNVHPDDLAKLRAPIVAQGKYEYRFRFADGTWHWIRDEFRVIANQDGRPAEIVGSWIEITADKEADIAKSRFFDTVAHQLRMPLHCVLEAVEHLVLLRAPASAAEAELHEIVKEGSRLLRGVFDEFLDLSLLDGSALRIRMAPCFPVEIASAMVALTAVEAEKKDLSIKLVRLDNVPPIITADAQRLRQILLNLLVNAVRFTDKGSIALSVAPAELNGQAACSFSVTDTGVGMSAEVLPHVFTPFYQGDNNLTHQFHGCGLGLAISERLAKAMGGIITARSTAGEGSCFQLIIPVGNPVADDPLTENEPQVNGTTRI
jgi:PAS domain S-box-containing protein